ncbi:MAG: hypothetical protein O7H41_15020 [Planctomycetota bacterium]|nr:hypothetical protein [Planctomycetota bacterium]
MEVKQVAERLDRGDASRNGKTCTALRLTARISSTLPARAYSVDMASAIETLDGDRDNPEAFLTGQAPLS